MRNIVGKANELVEKLKEDGLLYVMLYAPLLLIVLACITGITSAKAMENDTKDISILYEGTTTQEQMRKVQDDMNMVPDFVLKAFSEYGWTLYVTPNEVGGGTGTIRGMIVSRGYYVNPSRKIIGVTAGNTDALLTAFGRFVAYPLEAGICYHEPWTEAYKAEKEALISILGYDQDSFISSEEAFAKAFALYCRKDSALKTYCQTMFDIVDRVSSKY